MLPLDIAALVPLEMDADRAAVGFRFWDPTEDQPITSGLQVTARIAGSGWPVTPAALTRSGVYAFFERAGALVRFPPVASPPSSPPAARVWMEVVDPDLRFLPVGLHLDPHVLRAAAGSASPPLATISPPSTTSRVFYLFSAPTRPRRAPWSAVRGQLVDTNEQPCRNALIQASMSGYGSYYGLSDREGRFSILFPQPTFQPGVFRSPYGPALPPGEQAWSVTLSVRHQPSAVYVAEESGAPDILDVWRQAPAEILASAGSPPVFQPTLTDQLSAGEDLVFRTQPAARLVIRPTAP